MKKIVLIALFSVMSSTVLSATPTWHSSTIKKVYPLSDGRVVIVFNESNSDCSGDPQSQYFYIEVGENGVTREGLKICSVWL